MLAHLRIRDFVLIDELDIALSPGFNVLTGETGAGKSLVATALDMLLGQRASVELVRKGKKEAEVEGVFDVSDEPAVKARLEQAGLPLEDELLVRRVIPKQGRHRCYVNGRLASLGMLSDMAEGLASLMGQHEQHSLLDQQEQLKMLDGFGKLGKKTAQMVKLHGRLEQAKKKLVALKDREQDRTQRLDYLRFQLDEIERIDPADGELETLERDIERLRHHEHLVTASRRAVDGLYESDGSAFDQLGSCIRSIEEAAQHDASLLDSARQLAEASALIEDASRFLAGYGQGVDTDPQLLEELTDRLEALKGLVRKHGPDLAGVIEMRDKIKTEIEVLSEYDEAVGRAEAVLSEAQKDAALHASQLSKDRLGAAKRLKRAVMTQLVDLQFGKAGFDIRLTPKPEELTHFGIDRVEFLVALNLGEGAHPLRRVASGGELSRLMLALKRALAGVGPVGTYIFDEVDAGIGGSVAASVGRKLKEVATHHQVICITHLPQIAGMADMHLHVSKETRGKRTATRMVRLSQKERIKELARMLGGEKITQKTLDAARELMGN